MREIINNRKKGIGGREKMTSEIQGERRGEREK
jgi:hypothetical protein